MAGAFFPFFDAFDEDRALGIDDVDVAVGCDVEVEQVDEGAIGRVGAVEGGDETAVAVVAVDAVVGRVEDEQLAAGRVDGEVGVEVADVAGPGTGRGAGEGVVERVGGGRFAVAR